MSTAAITEVAQYLTFTLDEETYALEILKVREVLEHAAITRVPRCSDFMRGVINVRGNVVPVVDLKFRFGMEATLPTRDTRCVIMEVRVDGTQVVVGALADSVQEVIDIEPDQIEPPPRIGTRLDTVFIKGMGKRSEELVIILDIDRVFSAEELGLVASTETSVAPEVIKGADATAGAQPG